MLKLCEVANKPELLKIPCILSDAKTDYPVPEAGPASPALAKPNLLGEFHHRVARRESGHRLTGRLARAVGTGQGWEVA